jgi:hypothetical protein
MWPTAPARSPDPGWRCRTGARAAGFATPPAST